MPLGDTDGVQSLATASRIGATVSGTTDSQHEHASGQDVDEILARRRVGLRLFRRLLIYHTLLAVALLITALLFPSFLELLPIGGVGVLEQSGDVTIAAPQAEDTDSGDLEIVSSLIQATNELDRLGYARKLIFVLFGVWLVVLPISWVHKGIHRSTAHDHSLDETTLVLPGVVAAIVLVVQHSLALAFSLAGIIAGVQFRRALQDTFDALFILVAIGVGIAAGVEALEIAAILSVFFCYSTLYVSFCGDGLESDFVARRKLEKRRRKTEPEAEQDEHDPTGV